MTKFGTALVASALALAMAPAFAQDAPPTLRIDSGSVMTSSGGEFQTASSGTMLTPGERLMLAENSSATLVYPNGCTIQYTAPGVYPVESDCTPRAGRMTGQTDWMAVGIVGGAVALGALGLSQMDEVDFVPPPPVSP